MASEQGFEKINMAMLVSYFSEKKIYLKCTLCGHDRLTVPQVSASAGMPCTMALGTYVNVFKEKSIYSHVADQYYLSLICNKCGNEMHINAFSVLNWVNEKFPAKAEDEKDADTAK
ncbi:hypothetical protein [Edwardsiella tarda]|uniref:hypothetical protein n=1 Tax=Edwardsiella tarda TaxID=636 RepID=UPI003B509E7A